jgi:hypothetical protein
MSNEEIQTLSVGRRKGKRKLKTDLPTQPWTINKLRVDIVQRLKAVSESRGITILLLVNNLLDNGLKQLEAVGARKQGGSDE